jgi:hypothetical protein
VSDLTYGPVGDENVDPKLHPFEWAQARMEEDWHVEGQYLGAFYASRRSGGFVWGRTAPDLVLAVRKTNTSRDHIHASWDAVRAASRR